MDRIDAVLFVSELKREKERDLLLIFSRFNVVLEESFEQIMDDSLLAEFKEVRSQYAKALDKLINRTLDEFIGTLESKEQSS